MDLTKLALKRPVSCFLVILALAVFGISSIFGFRLELTPDIELPMMIAISTYPGADPESVDKLLASEIADAGAILSGVKSVTSMAMENYCMVLFTYEYGVDLAECHNELRSALETAALSFPEDASTPTIVEMNMNSVPILEISAIQAGDIDLLKVVNESVVPELKSLSGVAQVDVSGGAEDYIKIELDSTLMKQYGLTMSGVAQFLAAVDFAYPGGSVQQGSQNISVSTSMEYNTVQKLKNVPIMTGKGTVITLQDIATVSQAQKAAESYSRYNGQDNVRISIQNKSSYGTVNVCNDVLDKLEEIKNENPAISFEVTYNASTSIVDSLLSVGETLVLGIVLTMFVLFLFFGDFKASLIVGMSMPVSLFVTLIIMSAMGFSMNIVTMGALVIAIGMMVDSSIVVIESCFRYQAKKPDFKEAAYEGTREVTASIIASTITTVVVYLPLATMDGLAGQLFYQLGYTIVFAMLASLVAAIMLVPLFYFIVKPVPKENLIIDRILAKVHAGYRKLIAKILNKRVLVVTVSVALVVISVLLALTLNIELIPAADEGMVQVAVNFRTGTTLEMQNKAIMEWERIAAEDEDVAAYSITVGSGGSAMLSGNSGDASLTATLKGDRTMSTAQVVDKWNRMAAGMTNMDVTVSSTGSSMSSFMSSDSYEVDLQGADFAVLKQAAEELAKELAQASGVVKVENSVANPSVLAKIIVDPLKAMQYGMTPVQIGMTVSNVIGGISPLTITNAGSEFEVRLEFPKGEYDDLNKLLDLDLDTSFGVIIPLRDIAEIKYEESQPSITKKDGFYQVSLTCTLLSDQIFDAQKEIDKITGNTSFPEGVSPAASMMSGMMNDEFESLEKAILVAVFLVFLVMAMQFESTRFSLMVMLCVPFSLIGSFLLLFVTRSTLSMVSLMGFLMLMGIVVNNGILFVDSTNQFKTTMSVEEALIETGVIRLRPILMTTLTTILSMLPMGLGLGSGENAKMMQGMALVIIGGLVASTLLTLILIPTFYMIIDKDSRAMRKAEKMRRNKEKTEDLQQ